MSYFHIGDVVDCDVVNYFGWRKGMTEINMESDDLKIQVISYRLLESDDHIRIYTDISLKFQYHGKEVNVDKLRGSYARKLFLFDGGSIEKMVKLTTETFEVPLTSLGSIWSKSGKLMEGNIESLLRIEGSINDICKMTKKGRGDE